MNCNLRKMLGVGLLCAGLLISAPGTLQAAAEQTDRQAILATEQEYQAALAKKDYAAVGKFLDTDFEWTAVNGKIWKRAEVLKNLGALAAENGGADFESIAELTPRYYAGQVGVLYRFDKDPRYTHIWVKRAGGWKALIFFDVAMNPPGPVPAPNPRPDLADPEATRNCVNPCKVLPYTPKTVQEKEALRSWQTQKDTESIPNSQEAINAWETRTADDGVILSAAAPTRYIISWRLEDLIRMWKNGIKAPGGPFVISLHAWTFGDDCVIYTALQHPSEHNTSSTNYAVRIWVKKHAPFVGIQNPNPLPWESDHIWQIALSEAVEIPGKK